MTEPPGGSPRPSPISPDDLLQHARTAALHYPSLVYSVDAPSSEEIARVLAGLPYPSEADFRRAVSASYFALFHAVTLRASAFLVPGAARSELFRSARQTAHRHIRRVSLAVTDAGTPSLPEDDLVARVRSDQRVRLVADAFCRLSDERRDADYDHFAEFHQDRALRGINLATDAVSVTESTAFARSEAAQSFLGMIANRARDRN